MNKLQSTKAAILSTLLIGAISFTLASCSGDDGSDGATGAAGAKGETGAAGAAGEAGEKGDKGDKGDAGVGCTVEQYGNFTTVICGTNVVMLGFQSQKIGELVWMTEDLQRKSGNKFKWTEAQTACPDGWRLPSKDEADAVKTLISIEENAVYWTSTEENENKAYAFYKYEGTIDIDSNPKASTCLVRCIKE